MRKTIIAYAVLVLLIFSCRKSGADTPGATDLNGREYQAEMLNVETYNSGSVYVSMQTYTTSSPPGFFSHIVFGPNNSVTATLLTNAGTVCGNYSGSYFWINGVKSGAIGFDFHQTCSSIDLKNMDFNTVAEVGALVGFRCNTKIALYQDTNYQIKEVVMRRIK